MSETLSQALNAATRALSSSGVSDARRDARLLLAAHLGRDAAWIIAHDTDRLPEPEGFAALIARRGNREPVSRILGLREFWSMDFEVTPDTLDPRPDSETIIDAALELIEDRAAPLRVLDIGTGTGCLLLALLSELPNARGIGTDISKGALSCAARNATSNALADRVDFIETSWARGIEGPFDLIVSNPPYIPSADIDRLDPEVSLFDPRPALDGGEDGLAPYGEIARAGLGLLAADGQIVLEFGQDQADRIRDILETAGYLDTVVRHDLSGHDRVIHAHTP